LSLTFMSQTSVELTDEAKVALATVARAFRSDSLIGFGFRIEVSVPPSHDADADAALSAKRAEAVVSFLTSSHGLPSSRFVAIGVGPGDSSSGPLEQVAFFALRRIGR
jgi:tetrahydromethanopterin S-methyltransferase subunit D